MFTFLIPFWCAIYVFSRMHKMLLIWFNYYNHIADLTDVGLSFFFGKYLFWFLAVDVVSLPFSN